MNNLKSLKENLSKISDDISTFEKSIADISLGASSRGVSLSEDEKDSSARAKYNIACLTYSQKNIETKIKSIENVSTLRENQKRSDV